MARGEVLFTSNSDASAVIQQKMEEAQIAVLALLFHLGRVHKQPVIQPVIISTPHSWGEKIGKVAQTTALQ